MPQTMTVEDLSRALSLTGRRVRGNAVGSEKLVAELVDLGVLVPAGTIERVICDRCEGLHFADIEGEVDCPGWYCPADGFVKAEPATLAAYSVRVEARRPKAGRRNTAEQLAARLILELDGDGKLQAMGQNERHRTLRAAATRKFGGTTSLSKEPCNKAWNAYLASNVGRHGVR